MSKVLNIKSGELVVSDEIVISGGSYDIGVSGEAYVSDCLNQNFSSIANIISVRCTARACDLVIEFDDCCIAIEVKNKQRVSKSDVETFYSTIENTLDYDAGLFISLQEDWKLPRFHNTTNAFPVAFVYGSSNESICTSVCALRHMAVVGKRKADSCFPSMFSTYAQISERSNVQMRETMQTLLDKSRQLATEFSSAIFKSEFISENFTMFMEMLTGDIGSEEIISIHRANVQVLDSLKRTPKITKTELLAVFPNSSLLEKYTITDLKRMAKFL